MTLTGILEIVVVAIIAIFVVRLFMKRGSKARVELFGAAACDLHMGTLDMLSQLVLFVQHLEAVADALEAKNLKQQPCGQA